MIEFVIGTVTQVSPLLIRLDGSSEAAVTAKAGPAWTPTVGMRVMVSVDAASRARLHAYGPVSV